MQADILFTPLAADLVARWRAGGSDANGLPPERGERAGPGLPCRNCLDDIAEGAPYLTLSHRPFPALQPYAESGPIFLCAACEGAAPSAGLPPVLARRPAAMARGYGRDDRIVYGTGAVIARGDLLTRLREMLARPEVAYVHLRSALNGCYTCRVDRA